MKKVILPSLAFLIAFLAISLVTEWLEKDYWEVYIGYGFRFGAGILYAYYLSILNEDKKHYWILAFLFILMGILDVLFLVPKYTTVATYVFWPSILFFLVLYFHRFLEKEYKKILDLIKLIVLSVFVITYMGNPFIESSFPFHSVAFFTMVVIFYYDYFTHLDYPKRNELRKSYLVWIIVGLVLVVALIVLVTNFINMTMQK